MTRPLCFTDCETTHLNRRLRLPWETAIIRRDPATGVDTEHAWMVTDPDLRDADPKSLDIGRFWQRHPMGGQTDWETVEASGIVPVTEREMARRIDWLTRDKPTLYGAVVSFDEDTYDGLLYRHGLLPGWHHRLVDVRVYAAGVAGADPTWGFPDALAEFGLKEDDASRHTSLGDARLARDLWDAARARLKAQATP